MFRNFLTSFIQFVVGFHCIKIANIFHLYLIQNKKKKTVIGKLHKKTTGKSKA